MRTQPTIDFNIRRCANFLPGSETKRNVAVGEMLHETFSVSVSRTHVCSTTVNGQPCKPHLGSLCQAQGKMFQQYHKLLHARWVRYMSSIHLDSVLGFKLPRYLRPRYLCVISPCKIAIVIRAKKNGAIFNFVKTPSQVQASKPNPALPFQSFAIFFTQRRHGQHLFSV